MQSDRSMGLKVEVQEQGESRRLSAMTEDALFRVAQEGVTNMRKHAGATHLVIQLDYRDPMHVRLQLKDNGRGVDCTSRTGGRGLDGMRERIRAIGGDVDVQTAPDQGFQLTAEVPA